MKNNYYDLLTCEILMLRKTSEKTSFVLSFSLTLTLFFCLVF